MTGRELAERIAPHLREFFDERAVGESVYLGQADFEGVAQVMERHEIGASLFRSMLEWILKDIRENYITKRETVRGDQ